MATAQPFAPPAKRLAAALVDSAPILLFAAIALAIFQEIDFGAVAVLGGPLVFVAYHGYFNHQWCGESPGRRLFDIRLINARPPGDLSSAQCIGRPAVRIAWLVSFIPFAVIWQNGWYSLIPAFIDLACASSLPSRQTLTDMLCRTIVVRTPAPQPHRAPAGPMYSATDAEFGLAPRRAK